jgi:hypothetical protein
MRTSNSDLSPFGFVVPHLPVLILMVGIPREYATSI